MEATCELQRGRGQTRISQLSSCSVGELAAILPSGATCKLQRGRGQTRMSQLFPSCSVGMLAAILQCNITLWTDPVIQSLNPGLQCARPPCLSFIWYRSSRSGGHRQAVQLKALGGP